MRSRLLPAVVVIAICLGVGLLTFQDKSLQKSGKAPTAKNLIVASVNQIPISRSELEYYLASHRLRVPDPEKAVSRLLDELITRETLSQEARARKLDQNPAVREKMQQILIQALLDLEVYEPARHRKFSEAELKEYYESHLDEYQRPDQIRVADIFFALPAGADDETKQGKRRAAEEVLQQIREKPGDRFLFSRLIHRYSDQPAGYLKGDSGYFDRRGEPGKLDPALVAAAFTIKRSGQVADQIIACQDGFHIIMLIARKDGYKREFDKVKPEIERRLRTAGIERGLKAYLAKVKERAEISVNRQAVRTVADEFIREEESSRSTTGNKPPPLPAR